jgi:glycosyltransferase involved in cell wall biosynthesis
MFRHAALQSAAGAAVSPARPQLHERGARGRRLRVLQAIGTMHIGGAENVVVELCRGLDRSRFDVALCCTRETGVLSDRLKAESIEVILGAPPSRRLRHFTSFYLDRVVARFQPDIVHTHGTPSLLHTGPLAVLRRLPPWVHTFHFGNYAAATGRMMTAERWFCRAATQLVAVSDAQRRQIIDFHGLSPDRIMTIVNGVSGHTRPNDGEARAARRAQCGFGPDDIVVGCVAVLSEQKGVTYLIQAAREFLKFDDRLRLLVVGGGPLQPALKADAERIGLGPRAVFTGWQPDGVEWLKALDVFIMSSLWEAMPMALLEAMAAQKALVVTDVADNRAILENGRCGIVVPPRDAAAIADGVRRIVQDPDAAREMARRAGERFAAQFTTARMVRDYECLYERCAAHRVATEGAAAP